MTDLPIAQHVHSHGHASETCTLGYDARFIRRKRLVSDQGRAFLLDLPQTTSLDHGAVLHLNDASRIAIQAAPEPLLAITGDLPRLAWHIGNRHTPCQIEPGRLMIQRDAVIAHMLGILGADVTEVTAPFTPEGGAYGHGRTHAHEHGHSAHDHSHAP